MARRKSRLVLVDLATPMKAKRQNRVNLFELAYQRIEELLINCTLRPGQSLTMQDLQDMTGFGRTPIHHAVNRLAADTLVLIRPRHGLKIAPIDLARERLLLKLRRDIERFVIRLATERAGPTERHQLLHMERMLRDRRENLTLNEFNVLDRAIDRLILSTANEPFLIHTLQPLHTLFRRIGFIFHSQVPGRNTLTRTVDCHMAIVNAVANRHVERAVEASDALMVHVDAMFDDMESVIDPTLLDTSIEPMMGI
ncbi:MAG: transcriptional regulator [Rhizobiales bacterium PAR1]|nr:MAG: transcriptional regulator [Rhizobiales bacterium PAR1]